MRSLFKRPWLRWSIALFAIFTAIGALLFSYHTLDDLANGTTGTWPRRLIEESTGAYAALALFPLVLWITRRFPMCRKRWANASMAWFGGAIVYSVAHTAILAASRAALFHLFALGAYDYGFMLLRYPMEASNDLLSYAFFAVTITLVDRMASARRAELGAVELQRKLAEVRLENLRLQLHPHFLFNTLNAISAVMYEDVRKADEMLVRLGDFLRRVLATSGADEVPLGEELEVERMYVEIMGARLERRLTMTVRVTDDARTSRVPFLLLQPLLENSIRHGMSDERASIALDIEACLERDALRICVVDDGRGIDPAFSSGIGLRNVRERIDLARGGRGGFSIEPREGGGTIATLRLPVSDEERG